MQKDFPLIHDIAAELVNLETSHGPNVDAVLVMGPDVLDIHFDNNTKRTLTLGEPEDA